jgi:flagellar P-ring protein FlgI
VEENPTVVQPAPFSRGRTAVEPNSNITVEEERAPMFAVGGGANLSDIIKAINAIGATASDLVAILEALKQAGALRAELVIL